ncbi:5-carboxymethyl-2-hydroxymuconate isomerase [Arthrobacter sp. StoSoilA2]|uniref:fumarylacetoacetate hydrolase family protein n=1 Tax=Arthrobacter sp. StoSoilA2 TaxID=2830990 RepID=UPI001CC72EDC|nr:fumarylacetoacetate hydrolase family protein [Arthrobacter sp. StoSoilA2]BCW34738.1 5-carboxymethyl-2-hydroxymuconate isomerase [Arthrobacter sp. StoSoilA2]
MQTLWKTTQPVVPVSGSDHGFPVRRIYCVGRNYVDHIREMREGDERDDPFFFQKPTDCVELDGAAIAYPQSTDDFQFEGELVVAVGKRLRNSQPEDTSDAVFGYAAGIDLTRRDLQRNSVSQARPWEPGKSFDSSAPCGPILPAASVQDLETATLVLTVNGKERQRTSLGLMIWSVPEILSRLSSLYTLEPGDLIYTGTPAGVSAIVPGDQVSVEITGLPQLSIAVTEQEES